MTKELVASNVEWKKWGEKDPLMGVATRSGRGRGGPNPWTAEEFYQLGRSDWEDFFARWRRYGVDSASCLEIGCGTGRFTRQLAGQFGSVHALDVSEGMIEYARQQLKDAGERVTFVLGDGVHIPLGDAAVTAVFSTHVFQHFDSLAHAAVYFREAARVLSPGGTLMIHLPIHHWPAMPGAFDALYRVRKQVGDVRAWVRRKLMLYGLSRHHFMRGLSYPMPYLFELLASVGLTDIEIAVFKTKEEQVVHPFVLARKP